ncbi:MAG: nitrile hydratase subunit alpha [Cyanobacteriota bacterium]|nr:nitrile hydratase subunit alpha [Cyanobacteriota bacterium]
MTDNKQRQPSPNAQGRRDVLKRMAIAAAAAGSVVVPATGQAKAPSEAKALEPSPRRDSNQDLDDLGGSPVAEGRYANGEQPLPTVKERVLALKSLLIEKGVIPAPMLDQFVEYYEKSVGPHLGAAVVAHAWKDEGFRQQLLHPPAGAPFKVSLVLQDFFFKTINPDTGKPLLQKELVIPGTAIGPEGNYVKILKNGLQDSGPSAGKFVHNIVSCTICSCYPQAVLGIQPTWYKSQQYRSRVITDPIGIVDEFMQDLIGISPAKRRRWQAYRERIEEVQVWDSNSEVRFFVIPEVPEEWTHLSEAELRKKVTRNSMIGSEILLD